MTAGRYPVLEAQRRGGRGASLSVGVTASGMVPRVTRWTASRPVHSQIFKAMDLILDGNGPVYLQLARALRDAVVAGRLETGGRLPSTRDLAEDLKVSRTTVVAAYEHLRTDGFIEGKIGSGTYICAPGGRGGKPERVVDPVAPQSAYSRRLRCSDDVNRLPGGRPPGMRYAFQFGLPLVSNTITTQWARQLAKVAPYVQPGYPAPEGLPGLRDAIARHVARTRGVACSRDDVLVVGGATQALSLLARVLLDEGDPVAIEDPHWLGARCAFQLAGAALHGVPVDADGMRTDLLPDRPAKLVYVTPSHQFPTGAVLSQDRRMQLLDYVRATSGWIIEDDYDGEFRHAREPVEALQSLDRDGRVIYVGSFSKTLFPALRLGYIIAPPTLRKDLLAAKWASDYGTPSLEQAALEALIRSGAFDRHLRLVTRKLAERRRLLRQSLEQQLGNRVEIIDSYSGMHFMMWINGLAHSDGDALVSAAAQRQLAVYPVTRCYFDAPPRLGLIMGFGAIFAREIPAAVTTLAQAIHSLDPKPGASRAPPPG